MKKNVMMRVASALLVAVLMTTCAISGTFAKYTTSDTDTDTARVAKFGIQVDVVVDGAFATEYAATESVTDVSSNVIANTVVSSNADNLLAPGTDGTLLKTATVTGTSEVAVNVKKVAALTLTGWEVDGAYYCPLVINGISGLDYASADAFAAAVVASLNSDVNYAPNTVLAETTTVSWAWAIRTGADEATKAANDIKDTKLGQAGTAAIAFSYTITVTQVD